MFGWFRKRAKPAEPEAIAHQPPGELFVWPAGVTLTAIDPLVLAAPVALLESERPMGEFIFGHPDMGFSAPSGSEVFLLRLEPGMSVRLAKSVQAFVHAEDKQPRRLKASGPGVKQAGSGAAPDRGGTTAFPTTAH